MDDRQRQIRAGAGLEESRINQEFIDFLTKWSTPVLWLLVIIGGAWWGLRYWKQHKIAKVDAAFASYSEAISGGNPSPPSLKSIAAEYSGVKSVSALALLDTVDIYLRAATIGIEPGAELDPATQAPANPSDLLDEDRVRSYLAQARDLARQVADSVEGQAGKSLIGARAWMRVAAAQEGLGATDEAKASYARAAEVARAGGYEAIAIVAEERAAAAGSVAGVVLPAADLLEPLPGEEPAETPVTKDPAIDAPADASSEEPGDPSTDAPVSDPQSDAPAQP
ncbi:MAG: hypothetical protein D6692_10990 [Planctomycetota bacterium]|nr:MAG: hypothetical protein D6692_10990 [Planctomycetota bacterium]